MCQRKTNGKAIHVFPKRTEAHRYVQHKFVSVEKENDPTVVYMTSIDTAVSNEKYG